MRGTGEEGRFAWMPVQDPNPSLQLLKQRIRENIIDYLDIASSAEEQLDYERRVPIAHVPSEMINMWEDSVDAADFDWFAPPVFSLAEREAIRSFHAVWDSVAAETPDPMPYTIAALIGSAPWDRLMRAAQRAAAIFHRRGRFSRDHEEPLGVLGDHGTPQG